MIDFAEVNAAIQARMTAQWTATPISNVAFVNAAFTPPPDGSPWMRLSVVERQGQKPIDWKTPETAGQRSYGAIYIVAYVAAGSGDAALEQLLTAAKTLFEGVTITTTNYVVRTQSSTFLPAAPEAGWFKKLVMINLWASHI